MSTINPLISVIVPTFNGEKTVLRALDSVLLQTHNNLEVIVVDDNSEDDTVNLIRAYNNNKIRIISKPNTLKGASSSRLMAMQLCNGEYICNIDQDDEWPPERLEKMLDLVNANKYIDICIYGNVTLKCNGKVNKERTRKIHQLGKASKSIGLLSIVLSPPPRIGACMFQKSSLLKAGSFEENSKGGEDWILHAKLIDIGCKYIKYQEDVLTRHENNKNTSIAKHHIRNDEFSKRAATHLKSQTFGNVLSIIFRIMHSYRRLRFSSKYKQSNKN